MILKYMKQLNLFAIIVGLFLALPALAETTVYQPIAPTGYMAITWAKAHGITTFIKAPAGNGNFDYLTIIYLPYNQIKFVATSTPLIEWGPAQAPFSDDNAKNWATAKVVAEQIKQQNSTLQFMWNAPFFNITGATTDLSLGLKTGSSTQTYITSGSRPAADIAQPRKMLLINNTAGTGAITDFDVKTFIDTASGDQAVEGFAPQLLKTDNGSSATARLYLGMKPNNQELVIYCSNQATAQQASDALSAAGVPIKNQLQADGGQSATCAYNLPGQYFVEPGRMLPYLMGAFQIVARGTVSVDKLNVRSGPSIKFPVVDQLIKQTPIIAYEEKDGWLRISDSSQRWVSGQYIKKSN